MHAQQLNARTLTARFPDEQERIAYKAKMQTIQLSKLSVRWSPEISLALAADVLHSNYGRDTLLKHDDGTIANDDDILAVRPNREGGVIFNPYIRTPLQPGLPQDVSAALRLDKRNTYGFTSVNEQEANSINFVTLQFNGVTGLYNVNRYFAGGPIDQPLFQVSSGHYDLKKPGYAVNISGTGASYSLLAHTNAQKGPRLRMSFDKDGALADTYSMPAICVFKDNDVGLSELDKEKSEQALEVAYDFGSLFSLFTQWPGRAAAQANRLIDKLAL
jgi:hypothetical protein